MDILSDKGVNTREHLKPADLVRLWETHGIEWVKVRRINPGGILRSQTKGRSKGVNGGSDARLSISISAMSVATKKDEKEKAMLGGESSIVDPNYESLLQSVVYQRGANIFQQTWLCHNRYLIQQARKMDSLFLEIGVAFLAGALMGIAVAGRKGELFIGIPVKPYTLISSSTLTWLIPQLGLLIGISTGLAGAPAGVKVFGEEKTVYWREAAAGFVPHKYSLSNLC
jgi:hypothetical protein